jgi:RNA polymerase sigma factor
MEEFNLQEIIAAQNGDPLAREQFIQNHKPFITRVSSVICQKYLNWDNDDELSIALYAFNEAIDNYNPQKGASFAGFAQKVIRRRLIDYFRKESKEQLINSSPMDANDPEFNRYDAGASQELYQENQQKADFAEVVKLYTKELLEYGLNLEDLVKSSPKHRDSKERLLKAAYELSNQPNLLNYMKQQKMLPLKELECLTGLKRKVLEKGRRYIIAITLILTEPEFYPLRTFTKFEEPKGGNLNA